MYFVDQSKMEELLLYMEKLLHELSSRPYTGMVEKLALERTGHMLIESLLDTGNMMIDGFIMRDPGSYEDIIDILVDEKVLPADEEQSYKQVVQLRKTLVQDYMTVDHDRIAAVLLENKPVLEQFGTHVRNYLKNELGVANAFTGE